MLKRVLTSKPLLTILAALILVSCSSGPDESRVAQGTREGVLHFGNGAELQGLDPHVITGVPENHIMLAIFEGLVTKNPYTLDIEPGVAESWNISDDGRTYTFQLREDAYWSNGDLITSEDFIWSWQRAITPALGSLYNYMYFPIVNAEAFATGEIADFSQVGVKALDQFTIEVQLHSPTPYMMQIFDHHSTYPVHRGTLEAFGSSTDRLSQWARPGNIVTNGAFELMEWELNSHVSLAKRENYWDVDAIQLTGIVFYPTENLTTEERMFRDGQLHRTEDVPVDKVSVYLEENPEVFRNELYNGSYYYGINVTRPPFDDVRVRQALTYSIDRDLISSSIMQGSSEPSIQIVPPGSEGYESPSLINYDPELARQLLADAGYPDGEGFPTFELLYNTHESHRKIAVAIQQMWNKELNIPVTITNQEWKVYLDSMTGLNYDVVRRGWIGDYVDPYNFLDLFITDGGNNRTGWSSERYDQIVLREAPAESDPVKRSELYFQAETILLTELPAIPIYTYKTRHLVSLDVQGMPFNVMDQYNYKYISLKAAE